MNPIVTKGEALLYVPTDTPEAATLSTAAVAGVPLIIRGIMTLSQAGIRSIVLLITPSQEGPIRNFLKRYKGRRLPHLEYVSYEPIPQLDRELITKLTGHLKPNFFVINTNLLFDKEAVTSMPLFSAHDPLFLLRTLQLNTARESHHAHTFFLTQLHDIPRAEKFLTESIRTAIAGPIARHINKRCSLPASLLLSKWWVSPHTITVVNTCIGLLSGVLIADGHRYGVILLGAALFQIASIVDGCDGEVAKLTFRASRFGEIMDTVGDNLALGSLMVGIIAGYWRHTHSVVAFYLGGVWLLSTSILLFLIVRTLKQRTRSASLATYDKGYLQQLPKTHGRSFLWFVGWAKYFLKKDVFSFMVFCFALVGILYWWIFIAATGTLAAALVVGFLSWSEGRRVRVMNRWKMSEGMNEIAQENRHL